LLADDVGAQALGGEIDHERVILDQWNAVDDAIGSPDGNRFRQFVQSITLFSTSQGSRMITSPL